MTISCTKESCITRILGLCVSRTVLKRLNYYVKTSPTCMYMYAQDRVSGGFVRKEWTPLRRFVWMSQLKFKFWKLSNGKVMNQIIQSVDIKNACLSKRCSSYFSRMYDKSASWMEKKLQITFCDWHDFLFFKVERITSTSLHKNSINGMNINILYKLHSK